MPMEIRDILSGESAILCGIDGRNDSPRHSEKYCMYAVMEQLLEIIMDVEVIEKRETGGVSANMEVLGLKYFLRDYLATLLYPNWILMLPLQLLS